MATAAVAIKRYITDREWIDEHFEMLAKRYDRQYIAVSNGRVIANAPSISELKNKVANGALWPPEMPTTVYVTKDTDTFLL